MSLLFIGPSEPNKVVDHLGDSDCRQRTACLDEILDLRRAHVLYTAALEAG